MVIPKYIIDAFQHIIGLQLTCIGHALDMRPFGIGPLSDVFDSCGRTEWYSPHGLNIQCPWRIENGSTILTGSRDWYEPADPKADIGISWTGSDGVSLQELKLRELFRDHDAACKVLVNQTDALWITDVAVDLFGGLAIGLTPGWCLRVFPCAARFEEWRLLDFEKDRSYRLEGLEFHTYPNVEGEH